MKKGLNLKHAERTLSLYCELLKSTPRNITYVSEGEDASTSYPVLRRKDFSKFGEVSSGDLILVSYDISDVALVVPSQHVPENLVTVLSSKFTPKEALERDLMILVVGFEKDTKNLMECLVLAGYKHVAYLL